jgi:hypothetical protein
MRVILRGHADTRYKGDLDGFLSLAAREATRIGVSKVGIDISQVEFMSSSCIKGFVNWIGDLQEMPPEQRYRLHFVADPGVHWQRRTLQALAVFAGDLVDVAG